jgi:hypothetical protein
MSVNTEEKGTKENQTEDKPSEQDYELLRYDFPNYDLSFKVIVIGNSGNYIIIIKNNV